MARTRQVKRRKKPALKFQFHMRKKLIVLFGILLVALLGLIVRLMYIEYTSGEKYEKKVLSMLSYDSSTIPYQRGNIEDCNGTVLATSVPVYNVILDCFVMTSDEKCIAPTIEALMQCFPDLDKSELEDYAANKRENHYIVLEKKLPYDKIQAFVELQEAQDEKGKKINPDINGVWFEKEYIRYYPYSNIASSLIGFTSDGDVGTTGLENYYDSILNGINGREYGYLNSDSDFQKTVAPAQDGQNLICSIDENIQAIVEEKIALFNETYRDYFRPGEGSESTAVLIMDPNTGEIKAMADYPTFDLNNPRSLASLYLPGEDAELSDEEQYVQLNKLWQNYCVTATYEPGSVQKPFTVACGLETGTLNTGLTFECDGYETIQGERIRCVNRNGHGTETLAGALMDSCNDALMQMSYLIGQDNFLNYQSVFGFGKKTGIDLPGEANTSTLVFNADNMQKIDLATNSFGQNYNCTMVQMASAFSSLINGGNYYQPHVVNKITDANGNTIRKIEPTLVKKTVTKETSDTLKQYLYQVVSEGTGGTAKVDGYSMGGKTGTAQMYDNETHLRKKDSYLVSFMGYVPYENPQLVIYCIIDQPNVKDQAHSSYAQNIVREILKEVLPYMGIYPDEELTGRNENMTITGLEVIEPHGGSVGADEAENQDGGDNTDAEEEEPAEGGAFEDDTVEDEE